MSAIERFLEKINVVESGCWIWTAAKNNNGYGIFGLDDKTILSHRFIYEYYYGQICPDLVVHHRCYNTSCCNPSHLEERTNKENILDIDSSTITAINKRKTHCIRGHEFTPENIYLLKNRRYCRICVKEYHQIYYTENREKLKKYQQNYYAQKNNLN